MKERLTIPSSGPDSQLKEARKTRKVISRFISAALSIQDPNNMSSEEFSGLSEAGGRLTKRGWPRERILDFFDLRTLFTKS